MHILPKPVVCVIPQIPYMTRRSVVGLVAFRIRRLKDFRIALPTPNLVPAYASQPQAETNNPNSPPAS